MGVFDRLAEPRTLILSRFFFLAAVAVFAALTPWAKTPLFQVPAFIPVYESAVFINDAITAVMLFGLFRISRARALWWMATAYLFTSVMALIHMLTFPGLFSSTGLLGAGTQTTAWLYIAWHTGFPVMMLLSSLRGRAPLRVPAPILGSLVLVAALAALLLALTTQPWMPVVIENGAMTPLMRTLVMPAVLASGLTALVVLWLRRPPTVLDRWLWAALAAWTIEVALSATFNAGRFDLGFYSGRVFGIVSSSLILWVLLLENSTLYGQLEQSNLRLRESDRLKSQFLANMSHEIRTPLDAIIGLSSLELRGEASPKRRDALVKIRDAGDSLLRIVNDLLDLSRIEAGKLTYELTDFSLEKVMTGIAAMFEQRAADKRIDFRVEVAPDVPPNLRGDPLRLGQALTNLIGSAVRFTSEGEVTATVSVLSRVGDSVTLEFVVRDTGMGSAVTRGGLVSSLTKQLVEGMGGDLETGEPGNGTRFRFALTLEVNAFKEHARLVVPDSLRGLRVLVIVENQATRTRLKSFLDTYPFQTDYADSGKQAFAEIQRGEAPYQLVFVDLWLAGVSGLEILRFLKSDSTPPPAVIAVSSLGTKFEHDEAYGRGADAFLVEPVSSSALADAVVRVFGSASDAEQPHEDGGSDLQGVRVLVVEDNPVNRQITTELLRSVGMECDEAASGEEAVERLISRPGIYDLVLMDIQMPGMDGYAATRRLRLEPGFTELPIVALSAYALAEERRHSIDSGMNGHVTKPIDPEELFAAVREALKLSVPVPAALDTVAGLARVAGDRELYRKLLAYFAAHWPDTASKLNASLSAGDRGELARVAHTVKGSAGNLGITGVAEAAEALGAALRQSAPDEAVAALVRALEAAGSAVSGLLPKDAGELEV